MLLASTFGGSPYARYPLTFGLTIVLIGAGVSLGRRQYGTPAVMMVAAFAVVQLSLLEWYGPHYTPFRGVGPHWHSLWDLDHHH